MHVCVQSENVTFFQTKKLERKHIFAGIGKLSRQVCPSSFFFLLAGSFGLVYPHLLLFHFLQLLEI